MLENSAKKQNLVITGREHFGMYEVYHIWHISYGIEILTTWKMRVHFLQLGRGIEKNVSTSEFFKMSHYIFYTEQTDHNKGAILYLTF